MIEWWLVRFQGCQQKLTAAGQFPYRDGGLHLLGARLLLLRNAVTNFEKRALLDIGIFASSSEANKLRLKLHCMSQDLINSMVCLSSNLQCASVSVNKIKHSDTYNDWGIFFSQIVALHLDHDNTDVCLPCTWWSLYDCNLAREHTVESLAL
jgi:hypothetical protein